MGPEGKEPPDRWTDPGWRTEGREPRWFVVLIVLLFLLALALFALPWVLTIGGWA